MQWIDGSGYLHVEFDRHAAALAVLLRSTFGFPAIITQFIFLKLLKMVSHLTYFKNKKIFLLHFVKSKGNNNKNPYMSHNYFVQQKYPCASILFIPES